MQIFPKIFKSIGRGDKEWNVALLNKKLQELITEKIELISNACTERNHIHTENQIHFIILFLTTALMQKV